MSKLKLRYLRNEVIEQVTAQRIRSRNPKVLLPSRQDDVIPFADSEQLVAQSGLPPETLIEVGDDHRLAEPKPLRAMLDACELLANRAKEGR